MFSKALQSEQNPPAVEFFFAKGIPEGAQRQLERIGIVVAGEIVDCDRQVEWEDLAVEGDEEPPVGKGEKDCGSAPLSASHCPRPLKTMKVLATRPNRCFLDLPAVVALISDVCSLDNSVLHSALKAIDAGEEKPRSCEFMREQIASELAGSFGRKEVTAACESKVVFCLSEALQHLEGLIQTFASPLEKQRFESLEIIVDEGNGQNEMSMEEEYKSYWPKVYAVPEKLGKNSPISAIPRSARVKPLSRCSFAAAERLAATVVTSNVAFVRALEAQGFRLPFIRVPARALGAEFLYNMQLKHSA